MHGKGDLEYTTDPSRRYAYELDASFYWFYQWRIGADGLLHPLSPHKVSAHSHPNSLQFHPDGHFAYVTCSHGAICQYRVHSGVLVPLQPSEVYANNNPFHLAFDKTGNYTCMLTPGREGENPPNSWVRVYRIAKSGHLQLARQIELRGAVSKLQRDLFAGELDSFTVSGNTLSR